MGRDGGHPLGAMADDGVHQRALQRRHRQLRPLDGGPLPAQKTKHKSENSNNNSSSSELTVMGTSTAATTLCEGASRQRYSPCDK